MVGSGSEDGDGEASPFSTPLLPVSLSQSFDLLELYLELLGVRAPLLEKSETAPPDMGEALSSLCYASARVGGDLPELVAIRAQLAKKYGTEFVGEAADDATMAKW